MLPISSCSYTFSFSHTGFPVPRQEGLEEHIPLRAESSNASYSLYTVWLWVFVFVPSAAEGNFTDAGLARHRSMSKTKCHWGILSLYPFGRTVGFGFTLALWAIQRQVLCHPNSVRCGFYCVKWAFKLNQTLVCCFYKLCTTIVVVYLQAKHHCRSEYSRLGLCLSFSFGSFQNTLLYHRCWNIEVKALSRHKLIVSIVQRIMVFSSAMRVWQRFGEQPIALATAFIV